MTYIREVLQPELQPNYVARLDLRLCPVKPHRAIYPDVTLDLQAVFTRAYDSGGYADMQTWLTIPNRRQRH